MSDVKPDPPSEETAAPMRGNVKTHPEVVESIPPSRTHRKKSYGWLLPTIFSGVVAALVSVIYQQKIADESVQHNQEIANRSNYLSGVQTRISSCMELVDHYKTLVDSKKETQEVGAIDKTVVSTNYTRYIASLYMGRALSVCLAINEDFDLLKACVKAATHAPYGTSLNKVIDDIGEGVFKDHPAC